MIVIDNYEIDHVPENLEEFFDTYTSICEANENLTQQDHTNMWRDRVLFIRQRCQATSDYRENTKVRWIGKKSNFDKKKSRKFAKISTHKFPDLGSKV